MVDTKLSYNPDFAIHPGRTLKDELEFKNLTQVELAQRTGVSEKHISQIINGESPITPDTAIKLERALSVDAAFWSNLQKNYDLTSARIEAERRIAREVVEAKRFACYPDLVRLGCIEDSKDWKVKTENLLKFFRVDSLTYIQNLQAIAFRQAAGRFDARSLAAWLRCGEVEAAKIRTADFNKKRIRELISEIKKLTRHPEGFGEKLKEFCASAGIAVVYTPYFRSTRVNGCSRWIGDKAVIQLNIRGAYADIFWFTFFHELGHVLMHGVKEEFLDYKNKTRDEKEKEGDSFAVENLIPSNEFQKLLDIRPLTRASVDEFANKQGIAPSIVLGRLAHEGKARWSRVSRLRDKLVIHP